MISILPPTRGTPSPTGQACLPPCSVLGSCPPCMEDLNNTIGEAAETPGITLWMGPQSPDGQALAVAGQWERAGGETSPMADTGHSLVQLTQSGGHLSPPCSPPAPLTGQAQPHSQKQGDGQDGMGMGGGGTGRLGGVSAEAGQRCPHGVVYYDSISQGRRAAAHMSSKPLTDVRLGRMQTVQHDQAQTQGDRGDTKHGLGYKAGAMGP